MTTVENSMLGSIAVILSNPTLPAPLRHAWRTFRSALGNFVQSKPLSQRTVQAVCMTKIPTGIQNAEGKVRHSTSLSPARHMWEKFKRDLEKLPERVAHVSNLDCKVAPANKEPKHRMQMKRRSHDELDTLEAFRTLIELSNDNGPARRLFGNPKSHREMVVALRGQIKKMEGSKPLTPQEETLLRFLVSLSHKDAATKKQMKVTNYEKQELEFPVGTGSLLECVLAEVRGRAKSGDDGAPADLLQAELFKARDLHRTFHSMGKRNQAANDLRDVRTMFEQQGIIAEAMLMTLLERAMKAAGMKFPREHAENLLTRLNEAKGTAARWELLDPLLRAISDQMDGQETANQNLKDAIEDIQKYRKRPKEWPTPDLSKATRRRDVVAAIHDLARHVESQLPNGTEEDDDLFKAVADVLLRQPGLTEKILVDFLKHGKAVDLKGKSALVLDTIDKFRLDFSKNAVDTNNNVTARDAPDIDNEVFTKFLLPMFKRHIDCTYSKTDIDIESAIRQKFDASSAEEKQYIFDFFERYSWISAFFYEGITIAEKAFADVLISFSKHANEHFGVKGNGSILSVGRQQMRKGAFMDYLRSLGHNGPSALFEYQLDNTGAVRGVTTSGLENVLRGYFKAEGTEDALVQEILTVKNAIDYIHILSDIADLVRSRWGEPNFKAAVEATLGPTIHSFTSDELNDLATIVANYPALGDRKPGTNAAKAALFNNFNQDQLRVAMLKVDQIGVVAGVLRDLLDVGHGRVTAPALRQLKGYSEKILLMNGNVPLALQELRREAKGGSLSRPETRPVEQ